MPLFEAGVREQWAGVVLEKIGSLFSALVLCDVGGDRGILKDEEYAGKEEQRGHKQVPWQTRDQHLEDTTSTSGSRILLTVRIDSQRSVRV